VLSVCLIGGGTVPEGDQREVSRGESIPGLLIADWNRTTYETALVNGTYRALTPEEFRSSLDLVSGRCWRCWGAL